MDAEGSRVEVVNLVMSGLIHIYNFLLKGVFWRWDIAFVWLFLVTITQSLLISLGSLGGVIQVWARVGIVKKIKNGADLKIFGYSRVWIFCHGSEDWHGSKTIYFFTFCHYLLYHKGSIYVIFSFLTFLSMYLLCSFHIPKLTWA